jgi:hypothetical protein
LVEAPVDPSIEVVQSPVCPALPHRLHDSTLARLASPVTRRMQRMCNVFQPPTR